MAVLDDGRVRVEDEYEWEWESKDGAGESVPEEGREPAGTDPTA